MRFMSNTLRNTIVLLFLLILLFLVSFTTQLRMKKVSVKLQMKNETLATQVDSLKSYLMNMPTADSQSQELQKMLTADKLIMLHDTSPITFQYLLKLCSYLGTDIIFDFSYSRSGNDRLTPYNEYVITGQSPFKDMYKLVNQLEQQRALYTIENLAILSDNSEKSDSVKFSFVFDAYFDSLGTDAELIQLKSTGSPSPYPNVFRMKVYGPDDENPTDHSNLLDIYKARLIGMTANRIFMRDPSGIIRILSVGDKVKNGWLLSIDNRHETVKFKINTTGVPEDITLSIKKDNQ
jgi:hypothetical protein